MFSIALLLAFAGKALSLAVAIGDPHLVGPHGEKFDFGGQANGIYSLFESLDFQVNMKLMANGPKERFMTTIGVMFHNASIELNTFHFDVEKKQAKLNALMSAAGGSAIVTPYTTVLEFCNHQRVKITQRVMKGYEDTAGDWYFKGKPNKNITAEPTKFYYLDVEVQLSGCNEFFGGVLGQLFQCQYNEKEFVADPSVEESFRVQSLFEKRGFGAREMECQEANTGSDILNGGTVPPVGQHGAR